MSQYFKALAPGRKEYLNLDGAMGAVERITNTKAMTQLAFTLYDHDAPEDYYDYYGRWAGEDVRLVGDYDESGLYDEPKPDLEIAPLSNPNMIRLDKASTTAPDPDSVTEDWTVTLDYARPPVIKGSWNEGRHDCSVPGKNHPDAGLQVGSYVELRPGDDDRIEHQTYGVVMAIENDWTNITDGVMEEFQVLVDEGQIEQDGTALLPKHVMEA